MKKKVLVLVTIIMILSIAVMAVGCAPKEFAVNKVEQVDVAPLANEYIKLLAETFPNRTSGFGTEIPVVQFISSMMQQYKYEPNGSYDYNGNIIQGANSFAIYTDSTQQLPLQGLNLVFDKKAEGESKGTIILSTQYDNVYTTPTSNHEADGTYESGASTAMLLTIASMLKEKTFPFDLKIVFYGRGSYDWEGASSFLGKMAVPDVDKILLSIDLGQIIYGDFNYAYTLDKKSDYGNFINSVIEVNELAFKDVPQNKKVASGKLIEEGLYNYFHIGMLNNNIFMMNRGIPTLNIMSHNWDRMDYPLRVEGKGRENVYQTAADTYKNASANYEQAEVDKKINAIANLINGMFDESNQAYLLQSLSTARDQMPSGMAQSDLTSMILGIALKVLLVLALIFIMIGMRKIVTNKHDYYTQLLNRQKNIVEEKPIDVFGWDKQDNSGSTTEDGEVIDGEVIKPDDDDNDDIFSDL